MCLDKRYIKKQGPTKIKHQGCEDNICTSGIQHYNFQQEMNDQGSEKFTMQVRLNTAIVNKLIHQAACVSFNAYTNQFHKIAVTYPAEHLNFSNEPTISALVISPFKQMALTCIKGCF